MGRLTLNVLLSFAQFEREVTAERIRDKFRASKEKGMWMGGLPPLGYDIEHRKLVVNESEVERVRFIFKRYLELGSVLRLMEELKSQNVRSKRWVTQKGYTRGGSNFTRGALYALLQNPVYIGRIRHKDRIYDGQHEPIIDTEIWDSVQNLLASNRLDHRTKKNAKAPSLLAGLLFHHDGAPYQPRQTHKKGAHVHYYLHPSGTLPAQEIEQFVTNELLDLLGRQAELSQIIGVNGSAAMAEVGAKAEQTAGEIKIHPKRELLLRVVERVSISETQISIAVSRQGLESLLTSAASVRAASEQTPTEPHLITRAFQLKRCGHGKKLIIGQHNAGDRSQPDPSLLRTIARAHAWFEDLKAGRGYKEISARDTIDERLVARTARLAFLAPDITKAILAGREPRGLTSERLVRISKLPASWHEQRSLLGFD